MRKSVKIVVGGVLGLIIILTLIRFIVSSWGHEEHRQEFSSNVGRPQKGDSFLITKSKSEDIHRLITLIRMDTVYHVDAVQYSTSDSSLFILIKDKKGSLQYFNKTYHLREFKSIDGASIANTNHIELGSYSKRGERIEKLFRQKWFHGDLCVPLCEKIEKVEKDFSGILMDTLELHYLGDSAFFFKYYYTLDGYHDSTRHCKCEGHVDINGSVTIFKRECKFSEK